MNNNQAVSVPARAFEALDMSPVNPVEIDRASSKNRIGTAYRDANVLFWSVLASVLLHAALLGLLIHFSAQYRPALETTHLTQAFELVVFEPAAPAQPEPEPMPVASEPQALPEPMPAEPVNETTQPIAASSDPETDPIEETIEQTQTAIIRLDPEQLRQRLRATLDASIRMPEAPEHSPGLLSAEAIDVPGMPAPAGWLNNYVGPVQPSLDRWSNPGGALQARQVLSSGHVICTQGAHQPAFGPFDIGWPPIAMSRICGRERPTPIDTTRVDHRPMIKPRSR